MPMPDGCKNLITRYMYSRISAYQEVVMPDDTTRWTVSVSKDTDIAVRSFLAQRGMKKGDLSKFIEEAVRWRVLQCTVQDIRARNADADPDPTPLSSAG